MAVPDCRQQPARLAGVTDDRKIGLPADKRIMQVAQWPVRCDQHNRVGTKCPDLLFGAKIGPDISITLTDRDQMVPRQEREIAKPDKAFPRGQTALVAFGQRRIGRDVGYRDTAGEQVFGGRQPLVIPDRIQHQRGFAPIPVFAKQFDR